MDSSRYYPKLNELQRDVFITSARIHSNKDVDAEICLLT